MPDLNHHLGRIYHAINTGNSAEAEAAFRSDMQAHPELREAAQARLASITDALRKRDYISKVHADILERMINV